MVRKRIAILIFAAMALALAACEVDGTPTAVSDVSSPGSDVVEPGTVAGVSDDSSPGGDAVESGTVAVAAPDEDQETNFRFLISDERNAIGDFANLWVEIYSIGLEHEGGGWQTLDIEEANNKVDLVQLQGDNAQEILQAQIPVGSYSKVFIEVGEVTGTLLSATSTTTSTVTSTIISIKLPSSKLQINKPFEVLEDSVTSFVYDITVIAAGNEKGGIKYILKPVIGESGADKSFNVVKGKPDGVGKDGDDDDDGPSAHGKPEGVGQGGDDDDDDSAQGKPDGVGKDGDDDDDGDSAQGKPDGVGQGGDDDDGDSAKGKPDGVGKSDDDDGPSAQGKPDDVDDEGADTESSDVENSELTLQLEGDPLPGATSILSVTDSEGSPVPDATVTVNDEEAGQTDAQGELSISIPSDSEELEIVAILGDAGGELEVTLQ